MRGSGLLVLVVAAATACDAPPLGKVGDTFLAQAADTRKIDDEEKATRIELSKLDWSELPDAETVHLAVAKDVPWSQVRDSVARLEEAGKSVELLVAQRRRIGTFELYDDIGPRPIDLLARTEGMACVRLPGVAKAKCVHSKHVDRAHVRQFVREAVRVSDIHEVAVHIPGALEWADVVRAIDGARTCCKEGDRPRVRLVDLDSKPADTTTILVDDPSDE